MSTNGPTTTGTVAREMVKKGRKFKPTAEPRAIGLIASSDAHDLIRSPNVESELIIDDENVTPLDIQPEEYELPRKKAQFSYGSTNGDTLFQTHSPSPTEFPLSHTNIAHIEICGRTLDLYPKSHLKRLLTLAIPSVIGSILGVCMNIINLAFAGHVSADFLGGAALGGAFMLITGYTVLIGLCSSIDTLCSQAFGANQPKLVGLIAQRAALAYTLVTIPIFAMWCFTEEFFLLAGQDPTISRLAGEYVWYCLPTILPILYSEIIKRYLQAQSLMKPMIYVMSFANVTHAIAAYIFIYQLEWELFGASFALCIGWFTALLSWLIYLRIINRRVYRRTCPRLKFRELFSSWGPLFRLGVPGTVMLLSEWAAMEFCALGAGWLGAIELDTMVIFSNLCTFLTMIPVGIGISVSVLVGHAIGSRKHDHAQLYSHAAAFLILVFASIEFTLLFSVRYHLASAFTNDPDVIGTFSTITICVLLFVMFDGFQTVASGVLRGLGLQGFGAKTNLIVYYILGLPLGFLLAFYFQFRVPGLAIGLVCCVLAQTLIFSIRLFGIDWEEEVENAARRIEEGKPEVGIFTSFESARTPDLSEDDEDEEDEWNRRANDRQQHGFIN